MLRFLFIKIDNVYFLKNGTIIEHYDAQSNEPLNVNGPIAQFLHG